MRNSRFFLVLLVVGVCTLLAAAPAQAVLVRDVTTNTVVFFDDFEGLGNAVSHAAYADNSGDYDPVAKVGTWNIAEAAQTGVQVTDYAPPGPAQGDNYLRVVGSGGYVHAMAQFATPNIEGEVIQFTQMVNIPEFSSGDITVFDVEGAGWNTKFAVYAMPDGSVENLVAAGQRDTIDVTWIADTWQDWTVIYAQGSATASLTIDGVGVADNLVVRYPLQPDFSCSWNYITPGANTMYLDATVPEPSSIVLLVMGALSLLAIRRVR